MEFERVKPEAFGIASEAINNFLKRLDKGSVPMHSVLLMRDNKLLFEAYYAPYKNDSLHRMFSIAKSFTAIGIGLLADEGKISLDDKIIKYFPDMLPDEIHPWLEALTIRNMLMMRTCYASTTYVINQTKNWTESFFTSKPTLPPGQIFHYDTSAAQVLCSLVERESGMPLLDYLKSKLPELSFSDASYMLKEPAGYSIGGSGLMASSMDLLKFGYFLYNRGNVNGKQLLSASYIDLVTSKHSDSNMTAPVPAEAEGYGMQFWSYKRGGYMCYGMGGQFIIVLPKEKLVLVTTADTQNLAGGNQLIHDAFLEEIVDKLSDTPIIESKECTEELAKTVAALCEKPVAGNLAADKRIVDSIMGVTYRIEENTHGFDNFTFEFTPEGGKVSYTLKGKEMCHPFGFGTNVDSTFPLYDMYCVASAIWATPNTLYVRFKILDEFPGTIHMEFVFDNDNLLIEMKKVEESIFLEYNNRLFGHKA